MCQPTTTPSTTTAASAVKNGGINEDNHVSSSNEPSAASSMISTSVLRRSLLYRGFLTLSTTMCVPMYLMVLSTTLYMVLFYYAPKQWIRGLMFLYFPVYCCVVDDRPTIPPPHVDVVEGENGQHNIINNKNDDHRRSSWWRSLRFHFPYEWTQTCRSAWFYRGAAEYFPVRLHKTVDLPASILPSSSTTKKEGNNDDNNSNNNTPCGEGASGASSYIFLYHPHGVISMGMNTALALNGCQFDELFPGIRRFGVTLNVSFWTPLLREWMLMLGYISANKRTLMQTLKGGNSIVLVPGGAAEALHAHKHNFRLHINGRRGFIKLALETGALPVPCLGFGENEAFSTYYPETTICPVQAKPVSTYLYWQQRVCKLLSFSMPIITNIFPNPRPIHVVVGEPIRFAPGTSVDACHSQYLDAVRKLYDENKGKYGYDDMEIEFF